MCLQISERTNEPLGVEQEVKKIQLSWVMNEVSLKKYCRLMIGMEDHGVSAIFLTGHQL